METNLMDVVYIVSKEQEQRLTSLVELLTEFKKDMEELNEGMDDGQDQAIVSRKTKFKTKVRPDPVL